MISSTGEDGGGRMLEERTAERSREFMEEAESKAGESNTSYQFFQAPWIWNKAQVNGEDWGW